MSISTLLRRRRKQAEQFFDREPASRVARGAAFLDEKAPGWEKRINTQILDVADPAVCVVGQIYGGWERGLRKMELNESPYVFTFNHGFQDPSDTAEWIKLINKRDLARST
jgi:hypothetical protein